MVTELLYTSGSWECPARVFSVQVECWGAGGFTQGPIDSPNGGAGGGAYAKKTVPVTPGVSYSYVVGDGFTVLDTHWVNASTVMAKGGEGCDTSIYGAPGGDASQCVGDVRYSGGNGGDVTQQGEFGLDTPGGGGGGAGSNGNGGNATDNIGGTGTAEYGGDGGSAVRYASGQPGFPYGGGAGGCFDGYRYGGPGLIRITYYVTPINDHSLQANSRGMFCGAFRKMR